MSRPLRPRIGGAWVQCLSGAVSSTAIAVFILTRAALAQSTGGCRLTVAGRGNDLAERARLRAPRSQAAGSEWTTYSGTLAGSRFSALHQINRQNVERLALAWVVQVPISSKLETTPLVVGSVMYLTTPTGGVWAVDARIGRMFWQFNRPQLNGLPICCGMVNRGAAVWRDRIFVATPDARLIALHRVTGEKIWETEVGRPRDGYSSTAAPLVVGDRVVVGVAGGEFGIRGYVDAYSAETGAREWRVYTIPAPGEPGHETWSGDSWRSGGAPTWLTGSYDPDLDLIYWGTGNPYRPLRGDDREGDNLYTNSILAIEGATGRIRWWYQFTPHDLHDWDANQVPVLVDGVYGGAARKLLLTANRNGFFYVLDRKTGEFLTAKAFAQQDWSTGFAANGRPTVRPGTVPSAAGVRVAPGAMGGTNWWSPSYSECTGLFYVNAFDSKSVYFAGEAERQPGVIDFGSHSAAISEGGITGAIRALDPLTGELVWERRMSLLANSVIPARWRQIHSQSGVAATAGDLVFAGSDGGDFFALDATTGRELWSVSLGGQIVAAPMTYEVGGTQFVAVSAGGAVFVFSLRR